MILLMTSASTLPPALAIIAASARAVLAARRNLRVERGWAYFYEHTSWLQAEECAGILAGIEAGD